MDYLILCRDQIQRVVSSGLDPGISGCQGKRPYHWAELLQDYCDNVPLTYQLRSKLVEHAIDIQQTTDSKISMGTRCIV